MMIAVRKAIILVLAFILSATSVLCSQASYVEAETDAESDIIYGDLNGDNSINTLDIILLRRYIAGGYDVTVNEIAADVNVDNSINALDVILMRRFNAGGYGVTLPYKAVDPDQWVLESEVPQGATIVNEKWTYDEKITITSSNEHEEGYTLESSLYDWGAYGPWSSWSTTEVTESDSRQVETRILAPTTKTQYNYSRWASNANNSGQIGPYEGTWGGVYCQYYFERGWSDTRLPVYGYYTDPTVGPDTMYGSNGEWYNEVTRQVEVQPASTQYRYRDRSMVYTYTHSRTESKESATEVTPSDTITNVQKWVQYKN